MNSPAIVLSHGTGGLGAVRALGRRGVDVTVIAYDPSDPSLHSRYARGKHLVSGNDEQKEAAVLQLLKDYPTHGAAILTNSDRLIEMLSRHEEMLSQKFGTAMLKRETLQALNDKKLETRLVSSLGFAVPKTIQDLPSYPDELARQLRFPIIFKPYLYEADKFFPKKNEVVDDADSLREFYAEWNAAIPYLLAQEVIPGPDSYSWIGSGTFDRDHKLLDCGVKQKLRAYPAHFGGSTFAVSRNNAELVDLIRQLGEKLEYVGHISIEFRWDDRDSCYKYLEINPRLPANVGFDEASGMPTVWNSYQVALGKSATSSDSVQINGVYFLDLKFDLLSLRTDKTSPPAMLLGYLKLLFKQRNGMYFAWDDPKPALSLAWRALIGGSKFVLRKIYLVPPAPNRTIKE